MRIFEPYFTTKEMGRGTGLGLSIVYGIVKQHNGYIECHSELKKGTTFRIYLPLVKSKQFETTPEETVIPKGGAETILIAEDDAGVRTLMRQILEGAGYKVIEAHDGEDAVNKFRQYKDIVRLLIFDVIMPGKNGREAYEDIKEIRNDIKAIFISGYASDLIQSKGVLENGFEFVSKPVSAYTILRKVRELLDK